MILGFENFTYIGYVPVPANKPVLIFDEGYYIQEHPTGIFHEQPPGEIGWHPRKTHFRCQNVDNNSEFMYKRGNDGGGAWKLRFLNGEIAVPTVNSMICAILSTENEMTDEVIFFSSRLIRQGDAGFSNVFDPGYARGVLSTGEIATSCTVAGVNTTLTTQSKADPATATKTLSPQSMRPMLKVPKLNLGKGDNTGKTVPGDQINKQSPGSTPEKSPTTWSQVSPTKKEDNTGNVSKPLATPRLQQGTVPKREDNTGSTPAQSPKPTTWSQVSPKTGTTPDDPTNPQSPRGATRTLTTTPRTQQATVPKKEDPEKPNPDSPTNAQSTRPTPRPLPPVPTQKTTKTDTTGPNNAGSDSEEDPKKK